MANKVKYGLSNVHYVPLTINDDGTATYQAPVRWPGAVSLSLDAEGDTTKFRADNIDYWVGQSNNGYSGDLESALIPDSFRKDILGDVEDANGVLVEDAGALTKAFALMFQFEGDANATRHVLYNCTASRPSVSGETTGETIEPQTETVSLTASTVWNNSLQMNVCKARCQKGDAPYAGWFDAVYQSGSAPVVTHSVTYNLTGVTSSSTSASVNDGASYATTLTADSGSTLGTVTVTMGGTDVTSTAYDSSAGTVSIASVTGDVVITAEAS